MNVATQPRSTSPTAPTLTDSPHIRHGYGVCVEKTRRNISQLADAPKSAAFDKEGNYFEFKEGFFEIGNWTSSFFTGMALLAFESTRDDYFLTQTLRLSSSYRDKVFNHGMDTMHDLGFLYSLFSVALHKLTGIAEQRQIGLMAAEQLAKRFIPAGRYIRAWGRMDDTAAKYVGLAIVDSMMNLPLLFWAAKESGERSYYDIAVQHADTTLACFVRPDFSIAHSFRFDAASGTPVGFDNYCGFTVESQWARGMTWAIYGFALAFRHTGTTRYLDAATQLAQKFISQLDAEIVPVWDFCLPPGAEKLRDSSAAAIAVCGFDEILHHRPGEPALAKTADALLRQLCSGAYLDADSHCPGVLKNGQVGNGVGRARTAYTSWGDYYFMEALARRLHRPQGYW